MHSSVSYSQLSVDESSHRRRSSIHYIPNGGLKGTLVFFAFICGTTITFLYMRRTIGNHVDYLKTWRLNESKTDTSDPDLNESVDNVNLRNGSLFSNDFPFSNESSKPSWTWMCENKRCVRLEASKNSTTQSLKTCNMVCLETPVWPQPTGKSYFSKTVVPIEIHSFSLNIIKSPSNEVSKYIQEAFAFMKRDIHEVGPMKHDDYAMHMQINKYAKGLDVRVTVENDADPRLRLDTKENYELEMKLEKNKVVVNITADSFCGARHGLETLSQLIWFDQFTESVLALDSASVKDEPKFRYRGLLLDTARQYYPVEDILRTIDAMAASKLNTFHWHATDSQSFPLKLNSVPQMALHGAYSLKKVYSVEDIKSIVHRARVRGIRVVIEMDSPGHVGRAWSWGQSEELGELAYCIEHDPWRGFCGQPPCGQLNSRNDHVYEILEKIYKEILELTEVDDVFHIGGDEVNRGCWEASMKNIFIMDEWYTFEQKSLLALQNANQGKLPDMILIWSSKLTNGPLLSRMSNFTIQSWGDTQSREVEKIAKAGLRMVISNVSFWYFDCGYGGSCGPYHKWYEVYKHRPWENNAWKVEGGTACMWSELLAPEGVDSRLWPRGAALGERLWSDPPSDATNEDYIRMDLHRRRLVERGIRAEPIWPRWCSDNPYKCL